MLKSELIEKLAEQNPHLYRQDVEDLVNAILDTIADALTQGDRVELRGFGVFTTKRRGARAGRNPRSGGGGAGPGEGVPMFKTRRGKLPPLNPGERAGEIVHRPLGVTPGDLRPGPLPRSYPARGRRCAAR